MNKLHVALKLLQLLNERKSIDSRIVANELGVSLRTAQRYLLDLSNLPCVVVNENSRVYSLSSDYKLKDSLLIGSGGENPQLGEFCKAGKAALPLSELACVMCGNRRKSISLPSLIANDNRPRDARQVIDQLVSLVRRKLKERKCSFP